ncbi:hypothetical protein Salat_2869600 [Sesamum alatum]|uniref:Disease resistance protein n=1 Tax=Sesamum alatum TaxID=300844 RepID=A0AAE1XMF0_9LAMI|nr:hypothetical protein Salat_2869600 [Sesamum alatum]
MFLCGFSSSSEKKSVNPLFRSGIGLRQIRDDELSSKYYKRVSFMENEIRELPNTVIECPTVSTLLLQGNKELEEIPDRCFFSSIMSLKILDLSNCHIKSLPHCFDQLVELRALVLHYCQHLETLPPLGRLSRLQVLVCSETNIVTLPQETLSIYSCTDWVGIGNNAKFDMLPNLEDISLFDLTQLSCISDLALPLGLKFSWLRCIRVESCEELKYLISLDTTILSLVKLERILVYSCEQVEKLFKFDHLDFVFPNLKNIDLSNCPTLRF